MPTKTLYHLQLSKQALNGAIYAILPGEPDRVEPLAQALDKNAQKLSQHREYTSYLANFHGQAILVCSTGIGGPSCSIAIEELAQLGVKYFVRIGTTGAIQERVKLGDLVIAKAAVREDGASKHYAPLAYPAAASLRFSSHFVAGAEDLNVAHHVGIVVSSDTFYAGQERYDSFSKYVRKAFQGSLKEWQQLNVLSFEMEAATLFTLCNVFGLHSACLLGVVAHRLHSENVEPDAHLRAKDNWSKVMIAGLKRHLQSLNLIDIDI